MPAPAGVKSFTGKSDTRYLFYTVYVGGKPNGVSLTALANGSSSFMGRLDGMMSASVTVPDRPTVSISSTTGLLAALQGVATEAPTGVLTNAMQDLDWITRSSATKGVTVGDWVIGQDATLNCEPNRQLGFIQNRGGAVSTEAATFGQAGWMVTEFYRAYVTPKDANASEMNSPASFESSVVFTLSGEDFSGVAFSIATNGVLRTWRSHTYFSPNPVHFGTYVGTGLSSQSVVLPYTIADATAGSAYITESGVAQVITTDFTINTGTNAIDFVGTGPVAAALTQIKYQFQAQC